MELSQLRYFVAVAKLGNMSKAAETMFVSQPNLSTSISRLEEEMGVPLFDRRRGKIILNQNGDRFLKSVEEALAALDNGVQAVRNQRSGRSDALSLACMVDDTDLLQQFLLTHPKINLLHQRVDLPAITQLLADELIDLALTVLTPPGNDIAFERLYECEFVLLLKKDHPLAAQPTISRHQLIGEHLAIDGSRVNKDTFYAAEHSMGVYPVISYDVRHLDLLLSLVESNNCISPVPAIKYRELFLQGKHRSVVCRPYTEGAPTAYWGIAYHKHRPLTEHGVLFRNFVKSYFASIDEAYAQTAETGIRP